MKVITHWLSSNEPCHGLFERAVGTRWVQSVWVIRGDAIAEYRTDIGPAKDVQAPPLAIYGVGEDSVAECLDAAERHRHDDKWAKRRREMQAESTLISDILKQEEELLDVVRNRSHFGLGISIQRNDFPREAVISRHKEKRNARKSRNG